MRHLFVRLGRSLLVVFAVLTIVFTLMFLTGDPAGVMAPADASVEEIAQLRRLMGFDRPLHAQYVSFIGGALQGDFGDSVRYSRPALPFVLQRLPATLLLTAVALMWMLVIALPTGILSAIYTGTWIDSLGRFLALAGQSLPSFWMGILLILVFAVHFPVFPVSGMDGWKSVVLPSFALGAIQAGSLSRLLRSALIGVLKLDYIRTARSKGIAELIILAKHVLRNAALPVLSVLGVQIGLLLSGSIILEQVFAYPGMGRLVLQAVSSRDVPVVQAFVFVVAVLVALLNLAIDAAYARLDPRIRYS